MIYRCRVMNHDTAKSVLELVHSISERLTDSIETVKQAEDPSVTAVYVDRVSQILVLMLTEISHPLMGEHPDLIPAGREAARRYLANAETYKLK